MCSDLGCIDIGWSFPLNVSASVPPKFWLLWLCICSSEWAEAIFCSYGSGRNQNRGGTTAVVQPRRLPGRADELSAVDEKAVNQLHREQCVNLTGVILALHEVTVNDCLNGAAIPIWAGKRAFIKQHLAYIL